MLGPQAGDRLAPDGGGDRADVTQNRLGTEREPDRAHAPVGRVQAAFDQATLLQAVEQAHQGDRLDIQPRRQARLADPLFMGDMQQDRRFRTGERQTRLAGALHEAAAHHARGVVQQEPERAAHRRRFNHRADLSGRGEDDNRVYDRRYLCSCIAGMTAPAIGAAVGRPTIHVYVAGGKTWMVGIRRP